MKIGDKIYYYESDYRSYVYEDGTRSSGTIERHKYREYTIIGETKISWIISNDSIIDINNIRDSDLKFGIKIKKKESDGIIYSSWEEVEKKLWVWSNSYKVSDRVSKLRSVKDYDKLKKILEILEEE